MIAALIAANAALANIAIGLLVVIYNRKSATARFFFFLTFSLALWIGCTYYSLNASDAAEALFWTRAVMTTAVAQVLFFYLFITTFPDHSSKIKPLYLGLMVAAAVIVGAVTLSPFLFTEVTLQPTGG
jgi:hypothetical protein